MGFDTLQTLVTSGYIADVILAGLAIEAIAFALLVKNRKSRIHIANIWANLLAGACFALALRLVLTGASWQYVAAILAVALLAHLADLFVRVRG